MIAKYQYIGRDFLFLASYREKMALFRYLQKETLRVEKDKLDILWVKPYQLGYVWRFERFDYEPGIPSLMTFVREYSLV